MTKTLISALILSATVLGTAQAADLSANTSVSRDQVRAELNAARQADVIPQGEEAYPVIAVHSSLTRAEVIAEQQAAASQGLIPNGEEDFTLAARDGDSRLSRAAVNADLRAAKAAGLVTTGELNTVPVFAAHDGPANRGQIVLNNSGATVL